MAKQILFTVIFLAYSVLTIRAQSKTSIARNSIYGEGATKGATYSVNYDRVFSNSGKFNKSYRVGFCILKDAIALPLGLQYFSGQGPHFLEYSLTLVPYIGAYQDLFSGNNISDKKLFILPGLGYRYQPLQGGLFAKIVAGPVIYLDPASDDFWRMEGKVYPGITAGLGFSFK